MDRIPKELHLYWDGGKMSKLQTFTVTTFHKQNPDWNINLYMPPKKYDGKDTYIPNYKGESYFSLVTQLDYVNVKVVDLNEYGINPNLHDILRSDILRYHLLYNTGGVWSDFDVIWLKPMSHFNNIEYYGTTPIKDVSAIVSCIRGTHGGHSIGILIHRQHDPYVKSLIDFTKLIKPPYGHEVFGASMINKHYPTLDSIPFENVIGARFETYYPYIIHPPNPTIHQLYNGNHLECLNNNVICVHWYNGHILSKDYVNNNGFKRNCSMTTILKREGCI